MSADARRHESWLQQLSSSHTARPIFMLHGRQLLSSAFDFEISLISRRSNGESTANQPPFSCDKSGKLPASATGGGPKAAQTGARSVENLDRH